MPSPSNEWFLNRRLAAALFAVLVLSGALLFGASDRIVQLGLVFGMALGFLLLPPELPALPRKWAWLVIGFAAFICVEQFLPFRWFGTTLWHSTLGRDYDVVFPFTHNPEPGRAVDCLLVMLIAAAWFFWVRTLAAERETRATLIWSLFLCAAVVAAVSMALGTRQDYLIYGYRYTPGWTGFGPFPNRNHTAALLAMGALAGFGCLVRAARRRSWMQLVSAVVLIALIVMALLETKSRGGLLGFVCGAVLFAALAVLRLQNRGAIFTALAGGLLCATLVLSFGSTVLSRFQGPGDGNIPNNVRWQIWQDAIRVWQDAPLWGHGLGTFAQIYPMYQTVEAHQQVILHPESSWLQWLVELGAVPVVLGAGALIYFFIKYIVTAVTGGDRGFFLRAGAFAGVFALFCHCFWDVPGHRWGTGGFALALLAIACPPLRRKRQYNLGRISALVPLAVGVFWLLPFVGQGPNWSPEEARQLVALINHSPAEASLPRLKSMEAFFPLNPQLHEQVGMREIALSHDKKAAWIEFRIADRLNPSSWTLPAMQGWISREISPAMSMNFWSVAVERADRRAPEIFQAAYRNTCDLPGGEAFWANYSEQNPAFLLAFSEVTSNPSASQAAFEKWWKLRGSTDAALYDWERSLFYNAESKWGNEAQLEIWMTRHRDLEAGDFKIWATLLHGWQLDADAWGILRRHLDEPVFPPAAGDESLAALEARWRQHPDDDVSAQAYAQQCALQGNAARAEQVILSVASGKNPPRWFLQKAAYLYAARGDYAMAVNTLLQMPAEIPGEAAAAAAAPQG